MIPIIERNIYHSAVVALDFETTGLNPEKGDRVIEVAIVRREIDGSCVKWSTLINPNQPISSKSSRIHGISDSLVEDAPPFVDTG